MMPWFSRSGSYFLGSNDCQMVSPITDGESENESKTVGLDLSEVSS